MQNQDRHIDIWNDCLRIISQIIEPQKFETWFKPIRPVSMLESTLTVEVPTDFFREYLEGAYLDVIKKTLKRVIGADARLVYLVHPVKAEQPMRYPASQGLTPVNRTVSVSTYNPANNPGARVLRIEAFAEAGYAASIVAYGSCVGAGDTAVPSMLNLGSMWLVRIVPAIFLTRIYGLPGYWIAMCIELNVRGLLFIGRIHGNKWMKNMIQTT